MRPVGPEAAAILLLLAPLGAVAASCTPPPTDDWLIVDNRTGSRVVITQVLSVGDDDVIDQVSEVGPQSEGYAGGKEYCASQMLQARVDSSTGPVIDVRPASDGENCVKVWVIGDG